MKTLMLALCTIVLIAAVVLVFKFDRLFIPMLSTSPTNLSLKLTSQAFAEGTAPSGCPCYVVYQLN